MSLSAEFFAPATATSPTSRAPPCTRIMSVAESATAVIVGSGTAGHSGAVGKSTVRDASDSETPRPPTSLDSETPRPPTSADSDAVPTLYDMAVHLTRIYTKTGDAGTTALGDGSRVSKTDPRIEAYADVDETNAAIGVALALGGLPDGLRAILQSLQNDLFDVGADLCAPIVEDPKWPPLRVTEAYVTRLEGWCDEYNERLAKLDSFILPGGTPGAALLHVARTVSRRAARRAPN